MDFIICVYYVCMYVSCRCILIASDMLFLPVIQVVGPRTLWFEFVMDNWILTINRNKTWFMSHA